MSQTSANPQTLSFGPYRLISILGEGGMAMVYRAEKTGIAGFYREVALKVIKPGLTQGEQARQFEASFKNEARLGGALSHKNIVKTLDFGHTDGCYFIAMELVDGPSLRDLIAWHGQVLRKPIPMGVALQTSLEILAGLGYAHGALDKAGRPLGLVHRDLKPSNILLGVQGEVKISDFGIARAETNVDRTQVAGMAKGTLQYMSPEQAWGSLTLDRRSDLFAVGLMTYEMLTLRSLYTAQSQLSLLRMAQDAEIVPQLTALPPGMPLRDELTAFLGTALAKEPEARFQTADDMALAVEALLGRLQGVPRLDRWLMQTCPKLRTGAITPDEAGTVTTSSSGQGAVLQSLISMGVSPPRGGTQTLQPRPADAPTGPAAPGGRTLHPTSPLPQQPRASHEEVTAPVTRSEAPKAPHTAAARSPWPLRLGIAALLLAVAVGAAVALRPGPPVTPPGGEALSGGPPVATPLPKGVVASLDQATPTAAPTARPTPQRARRKDPPRPPVGPRATPRPVKVEKPPANQGPMAALSINSRPVEGVRVRMDGKDIGQIPLETQIPTGKHLLELVDGSGTIIETKITVGAGETWRCGGRFAEASLICRRSG